MEIAGHIWAFQDRSLPEALGTLARLGFRCVDLGIGSHLNAARAAHPQHRVTLAQEILEDLRTYKLRVTDFTLPLTRIAAADEEKRRTEIQLFKALLPLVKASGAPGITVSPGMKPAEDEDAEQVFERAAAALREMLDAARRFGLALSVEPHLDSLLLSVADVQRLLQAVPGIQITLDFAQMLALRIRLAELEPLLPQTRHVQFRPAAAGRLQVPLARSKLDVPATLALLRQANYVGALGLELLPPPIWGGPARYPMIAELLALRDAVRDARDA